MLLRVKRKKKKAEPTSKRKVSRPKRERVERGYTAVVREIMRGK